MAIFHYHKGNYKESKNIIRIAIEMAQKSKLYE